VNGTLLRMSRWCTSVANFQALIAVNCIYVTVNIDPFLPVWWTSSRQAGIPLPSNETWGWKLILANCFSIY
jgi:hypothetical protein